MGLALEAQVKSQTAPSLIAMAHHMERMMSSAVGLTLMTWSLGSLKMAMIMGLPSDSKNNLFPLQHSSLLLF
jgi:hypothetical protein